MFDPVASGLSFPALEEDILSFWKERRVFEQSMEHRQGAPLYVFYEGPPTANGRPGVHHVQARAYKDLFPRYKTMRGFHVPRKAGWDCHGLPVEIEVEKRLGFSGKKAIEEYGVEPFNKQCRASVMEYEEPWRRMTERMGYWVDLDSAYMTMTNDFIESVWWSLKELWKKDLLYLGYKVVPYCAKDGTPLSSHEVGLGYKEVRDPSIYVRFPLRDASQLGLAGPASLLVWTTTPWTLPGNVAAAVHPDLDYVAVQHEDEVLIQAQSTLEGEHTPLKTWKGKELAGVLYHAPYDFFGVAAKAHRVVTGDFVTATDGTGIVHIAPAFGADDLNVGREHDLPVVHSVDTSGHFVPEVDFLAGKWFKDADAEVIRELKGRKLLFKRADYTHSYPHCWRCRNPLMYYATDSWFIRNTTHKARLLERNDQIDWHPPHIRTGRYGDWLNNLVDWALSRTRYWGTPLPIWECECGAKDCVGSFAELAERSGQTLPEDFDPHRPYIDAYKIKCERCGKDMQRVPDVIDCWYDSGSMPFAQFHYPFENKDWFDQNFPADFICEGLDQTRGWFNSLHQLGVMLFDSVAYKTVICHGLVLDHEGEKMSKSRGNVVDPFKIMDSVGADAFRWYLYASAPPDISRRFSEELVGDSSRRYLGTLWNTYNFFVMNANANSPDLTARGERPEIDRWILSRLHRTVAQVTEEMDRYQLTSTARRLQDFVEDLSNWYVRRSRRRFWRGDNTAFQTLFECLYTVVRMTAPFTPFMAEAIFQNLRKSIPDAPESVHLCDWPQADESCIDERLLQDMDVTLRAVALGRSARTQAGHRTRQPLAYAMVGTRTQEERAGLERFREELAEELNVKELRFLGLQEEFLNYQIKPNLPLLGKKLGKTLPAVRNGLAAMDPKDVARQAHSGGPVQVPTHDGAIVELTAEEVLVEALSPPGYAALEENGLMVALSTELTDELRREGTARDLVRHIQELRKTANLEVTDRITVYFSGLDEEVALCLRGYRAGIIEETLALEIVEGPIPEEAVKVEVQLAKDGPAFGLGLVKATGVGAKS